MRWPGVLEYFADYLPVTSHTPLITLNEGNTPLVESYQLVEKLGAGKLYFKFEGMNPTGSFKDRGMVVAVAKAKEEGRAVVMCASTGNTSASAAAYAQRAGLSCIVLILRGKSRWENSPRLLCTGHEFWQCKETLTMLFL